MLSLILNDKKLISEKFSTWKGKLISEKWHLIQGLLILEPLSAINIIPSFRWKSQMDDEIWNCIIILKKKKKKILQFL